VSIELESLRSQFNSLMPYYLAHLLLDSASLALHFYLFHHLISGSDLEARSDFYMSPRNSSEPRPTQGTGQHHHYTNLVGFKNLPLIMLTSFAPSPIARVTAFLFFFTSSTTLAFCKGVTRQQITAEHRDANSKNFNSMLLDNAGTYKQ